MIQGEPLEETKQNSAKSADSVNVGPVMQVPDRSDDKMRGDDALSIAMGLSAQDDSPDSLDTDVQDLVEALADVERERDDEWIETAQTDPVDDDAPIDADTLLDTDAPVADDRDEDPDHGTIEDAMAELEKVDLERVEAESADPEQDDEPLDIFAALDTELSEETEEPVSDEEPVDTSEEIMPDALPQPDLSAMDETESVFGQDTTGEPAEVEDTAIETDAPAEIEDEPATAPDDAVTETVEPAKAETSPNLLGLQAINVLNEKISSSEGRYDEALGKIGHALGMIAERIDGLEGRMTSDTIAKVAMAAAPQMPSTPMSTPGVSDDSVAPYIAQAERELEARKESGPMDIFDRIAKAAETEFDGQTGATETRVLENSSDGRRVGTKRWQPSKTVKRRMEQLEKAKNGELTGDPEFDITPEEPRSLRADVEEITSGVNAPRKAAKVKPMLDLDDEIEEDDDAGLSVVPGARGRRKNRARKSRLDEDFENVFEETEDKPSIQSLRRKMRDRPVEEPVEEETKGGMLGGILGKKSSKKAAPAAAPEEDEDDLMSAFDAPDEAVAKKPKKSKAKPVVEEDDEDWDDEEASKGINFAGGPLLYVLIAAAAAAAFFAWQQFMG